MPRTCPCSKYSCAVLHGMIHDVNALQAPGASDMALHGAKTRAHVKEPAVRPKPEGCREHLIKEQRLRPGAVIVREYQLTVAPLQWPKNLLQNPKFPLPYSTV